MGSEYFINNQELENKVRKLLPSQGGAGAGFDLSASTQIIPIIDLTESAEGSNLRQDLQTALSHNSITVFNINNATRTVLITNTGYYKVYGMSNIGADGTNADTVFELFDGSTYKTIFNHLVLNSTNTADNCILFDFNVFLSAGDSLVASSGNAQTFLIGNFRQIASIDGTLTNPN